MDNKTLTLSICSNTDPVTGIITAFFADDYSTVTQGTDMDQISQRLVTAKNLVDQARKKYGFSRPTETILPSNAGFKNSEVTYQVYA